MSDDITTNDQNGDALEPNPQTQVSEDTTKNADPESRSPVERLLVWGLILVLLVIVAVEVRARFGYQKTLKEFENASAADGSEFVLTLPEFNKLVKFNPSVTTGSSSTKVIDGKPVTKQYDDENQGTEKTVQYKWRGLFKEYSILLTLNTDGSQEILSIQTNTPVSRHSEMMFGSQLNSGIAASGSEDMDDEEYADDEGDEMGDDDDGHDGSSTSEHMGRIRSFEEMDANGDGKLTSDEVSERMQSFFDRIDANENGAIDKSELEEARNRFRNRGDGERPRHTDHKKMPDQTKGSNGGTRSP